jgi:hypothetical protein
MRCHYCEREADVSADSGGLTVGLCAEHFEQRLEELAESEQLTELEEQLDVETE